MKITFYYWGSQCPVINETIELLNSYKNQVELEYIDFSQDTNIATSQRIYFPFLTVFNDEKRWFSPLKASTIDGFIRGESIHERPYIIEQGTEVFTGELIELNDSNFDLVSESCTLSNCKTSCQKKRAFLAENVADFYGVLHVDGSRVVGGVEYMPSLNVPYPVPKGETVAFITCVYHSSTEHDYKTYPLLELEKKLSGKFDEIIAITDHEGTFPNGTLEWFINYGFVDLGVVSSEENYCELHLVSKKLIYKNER